LKVLDQAVRGDPGHSLSAIVHAPPAAVLQRKGQGMAIRPGWRAKVGFVGHSRKVIERIKDIKLIGCARKPKQSRVVWIPVGRRNLVSGGELDELRNRAQRWRELAKQITDKQAAEALTASVEQIERRIACLEGKERRAERDPSEDQQHVRCGSED
jgi:hypothetical protein